MTNLEFLAMVAKVDSELAIALARRSVENPEKEATTTYNFNEGCGVQTVNVGCTFFKGGTKKAGKKPTEGKTKPGGQTPGNPSPPGAEPAAVPPVSPEEAMNTEDEDVDEDVDNSPPSPAADTASTADASDTSAPDLVL